MTTKSIPARSTRARWRRVLPWLAVGAVLAACSGPAAENATPTAQAPSATGTLKSVAVVTHGSAGDAFWNVVKNGAAAAGKQFGVKVDYQSSGDPTQQAKLIDNAVAQGVGGLVVSMANPDALKPSISKAVAAGIPVVTINSGEEQSAAVGAIGHVGQSEEMAGTGAGKRLAAAGKHKLLCVIHEAGNIGDNQRCQGATTGFGGNTTTLQVDINNPTDAQSRINGALEADRSIDAVLTLNSQVAALAVNAVKESNSAAAVATFDLNSDVVNAIKAGTLLFAIDQQQYEQGYLPIVMLALYKSNRNTVGGGAPVQTGPAFVDKDNVDAIATLVSQGTR